MIVNKNKKAVLSLLLSMIIPLSACGNNSKKPVVDNPVSSIEVNIDDDLSFDSTYQRKEEKKFALDYFHNYLDSIYTEYPFIDHYLSDEEIDGLIEAANNPTKCLKTYPKDVNAIISTIKANSEKFLKQNSSFNSAFSNGSETDNEINKVFEKSLRETLTIMMDEKGDLNEDIHRMQGLSIVFGDGLRIYDQDYLQGTVIKLEVTSLILGFYDPSINLMVLDPDAIKTYAESRAYIEGIDPLYDTMLSTVMHETNHVRQAVCDCRREQNAKIVDSMKYEENTSSALTESSAESELYNLGKFPYDSFRETYDYSYLQERDEEAIILLMSLFNENADISDYYQAIFDTDYQSLHNFLGLTSKEDIRTFYKVLYSMDGISLRNNLVYDAYSEDERDIKTLYDFRCDLGYDFLIDVYRFVLDRMSTYTYNHEDFTLEDNLVVLEIIQDILCNTFFTVGDESVESFQRFKDNLINMEHAYKTFLCDVYSVDMDEIKDMKEKTFYYEAAISNRINLDLTYTKFDKKLEDLLRRFPVLKAIVKNREYFLGNYERILIETDDISLSLN